MTYETEQPTRASERDPLRKMGDDMRHVQEAATRTMHDLRDQAGDAVEKVKAGTSEIAATAGDRVMGIVDQQKGLGADALGAMARAAHDAAGQLEAQTPGVARAVHQAADGAERISRDLRERSVGDLVGTVTDFARREPAAFFAGTVLAGLVLARFVKSSATSPGNDADAAQSGSSPDHASMTATSHERRMDPISGGVA